MTPHRIEQIKFDLLSNVDDISPYWRDTVEELIRAWQETNQRLEDARETLAPFADISLPGSAADSNRPRDITVTEGQLCQAWQVITNGRRWRP